MAALTTWESVKSCSHLPCRSPRVLWPQRGCPSACRFCMRTVEPGPGLAPGRRALPPRVAAAAAANGAPVPGPGAWRPLPTSELARAPGAVRAVQPLGPPMPPLVQRPRVACPGPILLPWDHCSGLGLQRVTMTGHCRGGGTGCGAAQALGQAPCHSSAHPVGCVREGEPENGPPVPLGLTAWAPVELAPTVAPGHPPAQRWRSALVRRSGLTTACRSPATSR